MCLLLGLPIELLHEVLEYLRPVDELPHPMHNPDSRVWDIRHSNRTLAAIARTCRPLNVLATPRLYSNYEARFQIPIHAFVDRISSDTALQKSLTSIITRPNGPYCSNYKPTRERRSHYHEWIREELRPYNIDVWSPESDDVCAQLEIWRLVSHAPNLQIFEMNCFWETEFASNLPPLWLHPITLAASRIHNGFENNGWFEQLHTLRVDLRNCGSYLALLFRLPSLQRLILEDIQMDTNPNPDWPESAPISKVHTLGVEYSEIPSSLVVHMIGYCQALRSFSCDRKVGDEDDFFEDEEDTEEWCTNILGALRRHSTTLKRLTLEPFDRDMHETSGTGFQRLDWRSFEALEFLEVSSMMLMGRPPGVVTNGEWSSIGDWQYPSICDVVPPKLRCLELHMRPELTPGNRGFETFFTSGLPSKLNKDSSEVDLGLKRVNMDYMRLKHNRPLPMDFWQIEHAFRNAGSKFEYSVVLDIDDSE